MYHVNDVSVNLGRQREGGVPRRKNELEGWSWFLPQALKFWTFTKWKAYRSWLKTKNASGKCVLSISDPSPPLSTKVDTDVIHMINDTRPSPSIFAYCKQSKTGQWEGLGTRLFTVYTCATAWVKKLSSTFTLWCNIHNPNQWLKIMKELHSSQLPMQFSNKMLLRICRLLDIAGNQSSEQHTCSPVWCVHHPLPSPSTPSQTHVSRCMALKHWSVFWCKRFIHLAHKIGEDTECIWLCI